MTAMLSSQIDVDANGSARIAGTRSKVKQVVIDIFVHKMSPEDMVREYPHLSLAQIHCALTYYYENKTAIDLQIEQDSVKALQLAAELSNPSLRQKLVAASQSKARI